MERQVAISLPDDWIEQLNRTADSQNTDLATVLKQAVEHYLSEQARRAIDREQVAYTERHAELLERYAGQYIAIQHGEVIDHDDDRVALSQRIRARYGRSPVFITPVLAQAQQTITVPSPYLREQDT